MWVLASLFETCVSPLADYMAPIERPLVVVSRSRLSYQLKRMSDIKVKFGVKLKHFRKRRGWSEDRLARKAGLNSSYVGRIERAKRNITQEVLEKLAQALDVPVKFLFEFDEVDGG